MTAKIHEFVGNGRNRPTFQTHGGEAHGLAVDRIVTQSHRQGPTFPWKKTYDLQRLRPGEVSVWTGWPGHGKSTLLNQVILSLNDQGVESQVLETEMPIPNVLSQMYRQLAGEEAPTERWMEAADAWIRRRTTLLYSDNMISHLDVIQAAEDWLGAGEGRHFVLDNMSGVEMPTTFAEETAVWRGMLQDLKGLAAKTRGHVHLVIHPRKGADDSSPAGQQDVAGSRFIASMAHNVYSVWRNKAKFDAERMPPDEVALLEEREFKRRQKLLDMPDALLCIDKNRDGGVITRIGLWFDPASQQFTGGPDRKPYRYSISQWA